MGAAVFFALPPEDFSFFPGLFFGFGKVYSKREQQSYFLGVPGVK